MTISRIPSSPVQRADAPAMTSAGERRQEAPGTAFGLLTAVIAP
ncbi:hypothetical protein [Pelagibacterium limicola]|nr:hypothetical protein [Pelagibacterium limicola]